MKRPAREEAQRWLIQAQDEFRDADELRRRGRFYLALFHFQQATEKALKAFLYNVVASEEVFFPHSISELLERAKEAEADFAQVEKAGKLDVYYIPGILTGYRAACLPAFTPIRTKPSRQCFWPKQSWNWWKRKSAPVNFCFHLARPTGEFPNP